VTADPNSAFTSSTDHISFWSFHQRYTLSSISEYIIFPLFWDVTSDNRCQIIIRRIAIQQSYYGSLLLVKVVCEVLHQYFLNDFIMTRGETIFGCMKVFMLEHNHPPGDSIVEIFRDIIISKFTDGLLTSFASSVTSPSCRVRDPSVEDLEKAVSFPGPSIPFYLFYW